MNTEDEIRVSELMKQYDESLEYISEMPWVLPDKPTLIPGTTNVVRKALDLRFERDPRTQKKQKELAKALSSCGLVWKSSDGTWIFVKSAFPESGIIRRATIKDRKTCPQLPDGWEDIAGIDSVAR